MFKNVPGLAALSLSLSTQYGVELSDLGGQEISQVSHHTSSKPSNIYLLALNTRRMLLCPGDREESELDHALDQSDLVPLSILLLLFFLL